MTDIYNMLVMILVMAGVTYLIRMIPFVLIRKKLSSRFLVSLFYYLPYAVLSAMTVPYILYSTGSVLSACVGTGVAVALAFANRSLLVVSVASGVSACLVYMIEKAI